MSDSFVSTPDITDTGSDIPEGEGADVAPAVTPGGPTVVPAAAPAALATVDDTLIQVEDEEVPLAVLTDEQEELSEAADSEDEQLLTTVEDEEVPLANNVVENVRNCILHFLEWLVAAALGGYYVVSTRKQKKEIAELRRVEHDDEERG